jgi:hypothetical protein
VTKKRSREQERKISKGNKRNSCPKYASRSRFIKPHGVTGMAGQACNSSYWGSRDQEDHGWRPTWQKVSETLSQPTSQAW